VSTTEVHSHQQHGRHHREQGAGFGITRTTQTVSAIACAAVMALVGTASVAQARPDDGGGVRARPADRAYPSSPGGCPLERIGHQLVRCDNHTGAGAVAPPWVPEQASGRAYPGGGGLRATPAPPPVVELLSRGSVAKPFEVRAHGIELDADRRIDVAVAHLTFQPSGSTGWHRHPGPTVVTITTGELTITDNTCRSRTYQAGDTFVEPGPPRHVAVNTADTTTETIVTFFVPRGAPALSIPAAAPRCAN
jgi:quercetin dioxygenase-like cupin family protein